MAHRVFGQEPQEETEKPEIISFDLKDEEGILCREKANGKLLIELVGKVDSGSVGKQSEGIIQVFDVVVMTSDGDDPDKYTGKRRDYHSPFEIQEAAEEGLIVGIDPTSSLGRLLNLLDDPDVAIEISELAELVGWLVEQYTGRPTGNASTSRNGAGRTGATSRRARRSQARTTAKVVQGGSSTSSSELSSKSA